MSFDSNLAAVRFATGRSPMIADPGSAEEIFSALAGPDVMAQVFPFNGMEGLAPTLIEIQEIRNAKRDKGAKARRERQMVLNKSLNDRRFSYLATSVARGIDSPNGMRERLTWFWADHFTIVGKNAATRAAVSAFVEEAIRPNVTGSFADMLKAVVTHPSMLIYLDQSRSVGPSSSFSQKHKGRGLNENLAREVLELHTLGVEGIYDQTDVRQLAELFAGLDGDLLSGFVFRPRRGEPGAETVLGMRYGGRRPKMEDVDAVLEALTAHPDTARHMAQKLAVHFVSDTPDPALVAALTDRYQATGGNLMELYKALLTHPAANTRPLVKVKPPFDFIVSALRALGIPGKTVAAMKVRQLRQLVFAPLEKMGQPWQRPRGPDGWAEEASYWITPQSLATRIVWAMGLQDVQKIRMPDPRDFVGTALGDLGGTGVAFAARAAETRGDGVGLVLASPEFQRR